jgi:hypothetical protein
VRSRTGFELSGEPAVTTVAPELSDALRHVDPTGVLA